MHINVSAPAGGRQRGDVTIVQHFSPALYFSSVHRSTNCVSSAGILIFFVM